MGKDSQIDKYIRNMRNGATGSLMDGLDEDPKEVKKAEPEAAPAAEKFEPSFEQKYEVDKLRAANRGRKGLGDSAEKTRKTVGAEMTEEERYRLDRAVYMLKTTKRDLIRTAIFEYLDAHGL